MNAAINPFALTSLKATSDTQFRVNKCNEQIEGLAELIQRGVKWKTPVQIAKQDGLYYLTDGFHRVEAYASLGIEEIPEGQFEIIECDTQDEVVMLAMRANAAHGNKNTVEDRVLMMNKLIQMDEKRYMKNPWAVDWAEVAAALQITKDQARKAVDPKNAELKEKRNSAILELHKEGKSAREIDRVLGLGNGTARGYVEKNGLGPKISTPESPTSTVPMASTIDRADTREDASAYISSQLSDLLDPGYMDADDGEDLSLTMDEDDFPPFDVLAATGYESEQSTHTKQDTSSSQVETDLEEVTAEELEASLDEILTEKEKLTKMLQDLIHRESRVRQEARINGITLSK